MQRERDGLESLQCRRALELDHEPPGEPSRPSANRPAIPTMAVPPPSASWEPLGSADNAAWYRREDVYSMQWNITDLNDYRVASARFGGPLALMRDTSKPTLAGKQAIGKPKIFVYDSAGGLLQTIIWDHPAAIVAFGFTLAESLVVLTQDGSYRLYPLSTTRAVASPSLSYVTRTLGSEAADVGVVDARINETGLVALLGNMTFLELKGWSDVAETAADDAAEASGGGSGGQQIVRMSDTGLTEPPACWAVVSAEESASRLTEVMLGTGRTVHVVDHLEMQDQRVDRGPFLHIVPSPNARFVALVTGPTASRPNLLWVASSDFSRSLSEYDLGADSEGQPPKQVAWCGSNSVVLAWDGLVVMVGPFGDTLRYFYPEAVTLVNEIDGTRIISGDKCEFLQKVPDSTLEVFRPGSASPSAILFDAADQFDKRSPKSDELLRHIRADLVQAVDTCIDAAGREFGVFWQRRLLRAASFGKTYLDQYSPVDFVAMSQTLRVLNAVRYYEVGLPITIDQYRRHAPEQLIARLTARSHHLLALRIADFLKLSSAPVLRHWAAAKVATVKGRGDDEDSVVCRLIVHRLQGQADVSCADVARTAWASGQSALATKLLDHEPRASKQVPLLLTMKEDNLALVKAIESGDPDLVYTVLLHLKRAHSLGNFFRFVDNKPDATALLQVYARQYDVELLRDFFYQDDRRCDSACLALDESLSNDDFADKTAKIRQAAKLLSEDKERVFEAKIVDEQLKLLAIQQAIEKELDSRKPFVGLSINETMRQCIVSGLPKRAEKIRADFKVPDKRWYWVKLKALTEVRDWEGLDAFAKSKRSPIGYEPFVEQLVATANHRQAVAYVPKCDPRRRVDLYIACGEWAKAGQECRERGDRGRLLELRQRCPNALIAAQLDSLLEELSGPGS